MRGESVGGLVGRNTGGRGALAEVEVPGQVAEDPLVLAHVGPRVGAAVGLGVQPGPAQEVVLDELEVGVAAVHLVIDEAAPRVGRDDQGRDAQAVAVLVDPRRHHVVVEAAPVVPGHEDRGGLPVRALHGGVDDRGHVGLALVDAGRGVLAVVLRGDDPAHRGQVPGLGRAEVVGQLLDVALLMVVLHVAEQRQRVPDAGRRGRAAGRACRSRRSRRRSPAGSRPARSSASSRGGCT